MSELTRLEQETIILFNNAEAEAEIFTYNLPFKKKLNKLCQDYPNLYQRITDNGFGGITYKVPKRYVKVNAPRTRKVKKGDSI